MDQHREEHGLNRCLEAIDLPKSTYYYRKNRSEESSEEEQNHDSGRLVLGVGGKTAEEKSEQDTRKENKVSQKTHRWGAVVFGQFTTPVSESLRRHLFVNLLTPYR